MSILPLIGAFRGCTRVISAFTHPGKLLQPHRSVHVTYEPKKKCDHCYYAVDHKTDTKFVLCSANPAHKQAKRNNLEFRLKQKFYYMGLRDLGATPKMINARVNDVGYANFTKQRKRVGNRGILRNNHVFDGLKQFAEETRSLQPKPGQLPSK